MKWTRPMAPCGAMIVSLWLAACGGGGPNAPPEIQDLTLGATTNPMGNEEAIHGIVEFTDPDGNAGGIAFEVLLPDGTVQELPPQPVEGLNHRKQGSVSFSLTYPRDRLGRYEVTVWLIDAQGLESNRLTGTTFSPNVSHVEREIMNTPMRTTQTPSHLPPPGSLVLMLGMLTAAGLHGLVGCQQNGPAKSPDLNSVAAACMRSTACRVKPFARVGGCMTDFLTLRLVYGESAVVGSIFHCVNQADGCDAVAACFGAGEPCNSSFGAYCDGDTAVYCDLIDATTYRYDCGSVGQGCRVDPLIQYAATCVPSTQTSASAQPITTSLECDDTFCTRTGEPCSTDTLDQCSGEEIVACIDGEIIRFNCRALGLRTCEMEENGWGHCRPPLDT